MSCTIRKEQTDTTIQASDGTRAYTGNIDAGSNKLVNLNPGTAGTDAVNKNQLDQAVAGLDWQEPADVKDYIGTASITEINGLSPVTGDTVVAEDAGTPSAGTSDVLAAGDIAEFDGTSWKKIVSNSGGFPPAGTRALVSTTSTFVTGGGLTASTDEGKIAEWDGAALAPATLTSPSDGWAILIDAELGVNENTGYVFDGVVPTGGWIKFTGLQAADLGGSGVLSTIEAGDTASAPNASGKAAGDDHQHAIDTGAATGLDANSTNTEGAGTSLARAAHTHAIDTATGTNSTINAGDAAADGTAAGVSRKDHQHAVATGTPGTIQPDDAAAEGVSTSLARADHTHAIAAAAPGTIQPDDVAAEGVSTSFARADHTHAIVAGTPATVGAANAEGSGTDFARADHVHEAPYWQALESTSTPGTAGADSDTGIDITKATFRNGPPMIVQNGQMSLPGDGTKVACFYFSPDGVAARAWSAIAANDSLYVGTAADAPGTVPGDEIHILGTAL